MKFTVSFLLLTAPLQVYCQACVVSVSNIIYLGWDNRLDAAVDGYKCKDIMLTTDNGKIEKGDDDCEYFICPDNLGLTNITIIAKKTKKKLGSSILRVDSIPLPIVKLNRQAGGKIRRVSLKVQIALETHMPNFDGEFRYVIDSYSVLIARENKTLFMKHCTSARFPPDLIDAFSATKEGDKVVFFDISCRNTGNNIKHLQPIEFEVTE